MRMSGTLNDLPGVPHRFDMSSPGESFVADAESMLGGPFRELMELGGNQFVVVDRRCWKHWSRQARAKYPTRASVQISVQPDRGSAGTVPVKLASKSRKGLEKTDLQSQVVCNAANLGGRSLVKKQVILKNFYRVEMGGCDGLDFLLKASTERNGGDRAAHKGGCEKVHRVTESCRFLIQEIGQIQAVPCLARGAGKNQENRDSTLTSRKINSMLLAHISATSAQRPPRFAQLFRIRSDHELLSRFSIRFDSFAISRHLPVIFFEPRTAVTPCLLLSGRLIWSVCCSSSALGSNRRVRRPARN